ncbi:MAG: energy transducer TonB, partial [Perlucidibaca sp.]
EQGWLALVVAVHVSAVAWAAYAMHPDKVARVSVMSVQLLPMAPPPAPPQRKPEPPKPRPPLPQVAKPTVTRVKTPEPVQAPPPPEPVVEQPKPEPRKPDPLPAPAPAPSLPSFQIGTLSNPWPEYPGRSRDLREEGRVVLRVLVGVDGRARDVQIFQSSGYTRLDESARFTVQRRWRFEPARLGEQKLEGWVKVPISFKLNDAD